MTLSVGKKLRLSRIVPSGGKTVIVPIDHGIEAHFKELENPRKLVSEFVEGGADALLMRRGTIKQTYDLFAGKAGLLCRVSGATGTSPDVLDQRLESSISEAVRLGADAVIFTLVVGHPKENDMFQMFGELSDMADDLEVPLVGEADVWDKAQGEKWELLRQGVRTIGEEGADLVKSYFPPEPQHFKDIVRYSLVPVVAAGGPKVDDPKEVLKFVKNVMDAGAVGTSIGRNVWQYKSPAKMIKAMSLIVKQGKSIEEAARAL
jgi:DhnA family fructose-bisphosphate aldolase class Ia